MTDTLKPCPWCAGRAYVAEMNGEDWWVECNSCGGSRLPVATADEAIAAWNHRTPSQELTELRALLQRIESTTNRDDISDGMKLISIRMDACKALGGNNPDTSGSKQ